MSKSTFTKHKSLSQKLDCLIFKVYAIFLHSSVHFHIEVLKLTVCRNKRNVKYLQTSSIISTTIR
jgi:hypothetical protein